ncbi:HNH endonuclease [Plantibacter flavus]|uniref:HNH endonuclease signature motif containing protein n=1 Tax=Plantibacter flavus TaxID=150123 RepID=UPI003F150989
MHERTVASEHPHEVFAARLASFSDRLVELEAERAALDAREARLLAEAAAFAAATASAIVPEIHSPTEREELARRSLCASLSMATRASEQTMQRRIGDAEDLVHRAPAVLDALERARIALGHARVITDQLHGVPTEGRARFLEHILPIAERSTPARLKQRARVARERLHPESIRARTVRSAADRRVEIEAAADGMAWLHLFTTAAIAHGIHERLDTVAAAARAAGDDRTLSQLRADAFVSLGVAGVVTADDGSTDPGALVERPVAVEAHIRATVQIMVPALSVLGVTDEPATLDGYGPIDPDTAARLTAAAPSMTRVLTHPETGAVLSVGREQYRVPADLQRAVRLRDATCRAPGCGRRARACDLDHSVAWAKGGTTAVGNLACLCRHHHRLKHLPGWELTHTGNGDLDWRAPDGRHHQTTPELAGVG